MRYLVWIAAVFALAALPATAYLVPQCPAPKDAEATTDLGALPLPVAASLKRYVPNLTAPGSPFNASDALLPGQKLLDRRLIVAVHRGNRWVVAYEAAGVGYHDVVVAYDLSDDGKNSTIAFKTQDLPASLCSTLNRALTANGPIDRFW